VGDRQSVAATTFIRNRVQLGQTRVGPDLTNYGARIEAAEKDPVRREQAVYN